MKPFWYIVPGAALFFSGITEVHAGMSTVTLSRFGTNRLIGMSTVLFLLIVVVATILTYCWNRFVKDTDWPRLTHPKAIGFTFLAGVLSFLVLVMIAGSRELLSPGAWKPNGILYELADENARRPSKSVKPVAPSDMSFGAETLVPEADTRQARYIVRREALTRLRAALWRHADENGGAFPESPPPGLDTIPVSGGLKYLYYPNHSNAGRFLVLEPDLDEPPRLALDRQGIIVEVETTANDGEVRR